jgi:hypothetical protein
MSDIERLPVRLLGAFLLAFVAASAGRAAGTLQAVRDLLSQQSTFDGKLVTVEGEVLNISYLPEIRSGTSYYFFTLADGGARLRVLSRYTATLTLHDRVRVTGKFSSHRVNSSLQESSPELDANSGDLTVVYRAPSRPFIQPSFNGKAPGIPTTVINTPWSVAVGVAGILSAIFAAVAAGTLYRRSVNVNLVVHEVQPLEIELRAGERSARIAMRLFSTRTLVPYLNRRIELRFADETVLASDVRIEGKTADFPLAVSKDLVLEVTFPLPPGLAAPAGTPCKIILRDEFSSKVFRQQLYVGRRSYG